MATETVSFEEVGNKYRDFVVKRVTPLSELQSVLLELEHEPTGAQVMHLANDDDENLFSLSFRTYPETSNGVAHILEHTVLCGSEKYPVKDPFFSMIRRSLNTFMNALTGSDFTCYPAASQVKKDFYNLLSVYMDAVFKPNLHPYSFMQEVHRLEFAEGDNSKSPLEYKGIVFNEMKGAMSSPDTRHWEEINQGLFPDLTYGINSGGDPKVIPELTHKGLLEFHKTYYHPSRCTFFFYGNLPLEGHLDAISEGALKGVNRLEQLSPIPKQKRHTKPVRKEVSYPIAPNEELSGKTMVSFSWLTSPISEQEELLALSLLDSILMDTDASPLKKALLKSGLCKQAMSHIDTEISEAPFIFLMKGCEKSSAGALEKVLRDTFSEIRQRGISEELVESALHQLELQRSEICGDSYPFGLILFFRSTLLKQHGVAPEKGLLIHSLFDSLREKLKDSNYLPSLIEKHFLDNPHMVCVEMQPDQEQGKREADEERALLDEIRSNLSEEKVRNVIATAKELEAFQKEQEEQDINVLPKVSLDDVPPEVKNYQLTKKKMGNVELHYHEAFTNKIAYLDLVFDLQPIEEKDLSLSKLFTYLLPQVGSGGRSYTENLEYIQAHTGGIDTSGSLTPQVSDPEQYKPTFQIRGKALTRKLDKLAPLLIDTLVSADFSDEERIRELLEKHWSGLQSNLAGNAMRYASNLAGSPLSTAGWLSYHWSGLGYYEGIRQIVERFEKEPKWLLSELNRIQKELLSVSNPHVVLTSDRATYDELLKNSGYGLGNLEVKKGSLWQPKISGPKVESQGCLIASPVAFTAMAMNTVPYVHEESAALCLGSFIADNKTLHTKIREQGGAYGGGSSAHPLSGTFTFHAYRDPNLMTTADAFHESIKEIVAGNFDEADLEEAKLEMIQKMDSPMSPGSRGIAAFSWQREGRTPKVRQQLRYRLLAATKEDVIAAMRQHILPQIEQSPLITFTGKELLEKENSELEKRGKPSLKVREI